MIYLAIVCVLIQCWLVYMMFRNRWVRDFLLEELEKSEYRGERVFYPYCLLPSYYKILYTFWVFDFYKFYPEEYRAFVAPKPQQKEDVPWSL